MLDIVSIVVIVFGILQIILFFKIWGMTNNVRKILEDQKDSKNEIIEQMRKIVSFLAQTSKEQITIERKESNFDIGDNIEVIATGEKMVITDISNGQFFCMNLETNKGEFYTAQEIKIS